jgi:hypothetical protein
VSSTFDDAQHGTNSQSEIIQQVSRQRKTYDSAPKSDERSCRRCQLSDCSFLLLSFHPKRHLLNSIALQSAAVERAGNQVKFVDYDFYVGRFNGRFCEAGVDESTTESNTR